MIRDEHPQIIATILVHFNVPAADILDLFDERAPRHHAAHRHLCGVQPAALAELTEVEWLAGRPEPQAQQNGWRENRSRNHQPDEESAGRRCYRCNARLRRRTGAEDYRRNVPVREPY
ncbi:hypothetical protein ACNKHW_12220 [Shigella flexneri]